MSGAGEEQLWMIVDPDTKEACRVGEDPRTSGPMFFTSRERAGEYAARNQIAPYDLYPVPAGILVRMKGKPHWVDGQKR